MEEDFPVVKAVRTWKSEVHVVHWQGPLDRRPVWLIRLEETHHLRKAFGPLAVNAEQARHAVPVQPSLELGGIGVEECLEPKFGWKTRCYKRTRLDHAVMKDLAVDR